MPTDPMWCFENYGEAAEYIDQLERQRDELLAALKDAREMVDDWGAYATAYMQEKHDLAGDLDRLDAAIDAARGAKPEPAP